LTSCEGTHSERLGRAGLDLSYAMQGRFWDERTGSIIATQITGREIWDRNQGLNPCQGAELPTGDEREKWLCEVLDGLSEACEGQDEDDMPCTDCPPIKIENGHLWYFNCGEWQDIGPVGGPSGEPFSETTMEPPSGGTPATYYACGKATAVVTAVRTLAEAVLAHEWTFPTAWNSVGRDALPGYDLHNNWLALAFPALIEWDTLGDVNQLHDDSRWQDVLCHWATELESNADPVTHEQFWHLMLRCMQNFDNPLSTFFFQDIGEAIGDANVQQISILGSTDDTGNCDCEAEFGELPVIFFGFPSISGVEADDTVTYLHDMAGRRITFTWTGGTGHTGGEDFSLHIPLITAVSGTSLRIKLERLEGHAPTHEWVGSEPCPDDDPTAWTQANIQGPGVGDWTLAEIVAVEGHQEILYTYAGEIPEAWDASSVRACPSDAENFTIKFRLQIMSYNGNPV
jgi:hypothetical protein